MGCSSRATLLRDTEFVYLFIVLICRHECAAQEGLLKHKVGLLNTWKDRTVILQASMPSLASATEPTEC